MRSSGYKDDRYKGFSNSSPGCVLPVDTPPNPVVVIREQIASGLSLAENLQPLVEQFYLANGRWPQSNIEAGAPAAGNIINRFVTSVSIGTFGRITITYGFDAHAIITGTTNVLNPTDNIGGINWACSSVTIAYRHNVFECR